MSLIASRTVLPLPDSGSLDPKCPQKRLRLNGRKEGQAELETDSESTKAPFCQTFSPPPSPGTGVQHNFSSLVIAPLPELEGFFVVIGLLLTPSTDAFTKLLF